MWVTQAHWKWYHLKAWVHFPICLPYAALPMAVSLAISEIYSVKEWPDLEIWVRDCSRSLKIDHVRLSISPPLNYSSNFYHLQVI